MPVLEVDTVLVCGAGSTYADGMNAVAFRRPPLNLGFFAATKKHGYPHFTTVTNYFEREYGIDLENASADNLEGAMQILYSDLHARASESPEIIDVYHSFLKILNRRIAQSTNELPVGRTGLLRRILSTLIEQVGAGRVAIVTFNYDVHAEHCLERIQSRSSAEGFEIFDFPKLYSLTDCPISNPTNKNEERFTSRNSAKDKKRPLFGVRLLKLHGSLNWFTTFAKGSTPPLNALTGRNEMLRISTRRHVDPSISFNRHGEKFSTAPVVVPPIANKAAVFHSRLLPLWRKAQFFLENARQVLFYGYSCPASDQESSNMFRRAFRGKRWETPLTVIDPSLETLARLCAISQAPAVSYFRNATDFLASGG